MGIKAVVDNLDDVDPKYHDLYQEKNGKFELTGVEGFKTQADVDRVQNSLVKERNDHKATKEKYSFLADMDVTQVQTMLDKYPELEAAVNSGGKLDEAAIQKLVEGRLTSLTAPLKRDLEKARKELSERDEKIGEFTKKEKTRLITDHIRSAASKLKTRDTAIEDAILAGMNVFEVAEDGSVITRDGVGVTPGISAEVWLTDMQSKKPHWWDESSGGGASGSRSGAVPNNPFSAQHWNLTEQGRLVKENRTKAEQMAKSAGTTIGGGKPK